MSCATKGVAVVDLSPNEFSKKCQEFEPPLDEGIARETLILQAAGIETYESCREEKRSIDVLCGERGPGSPGALWSPK